MPAQRILPDHRAHPLRQPIKPAAHVRRLKCQPEARPPPARCLFVQRPQARQPSHAALSSTAASAPTNAGSNPGPTRRLRPFLSTTSTRRSSPRIEAPAANFTSRNFAAPLAPSRFFHQKKCDAHNLCSRQNAATVCPLRPCAETNLCHFRRACLLRSRCVIAPASPPTGHDATLPHRSARCASHIAYSVRRMIPPVEARIGKSVVKTWRY